jgi:holo-[acyl-carrier protein] synthase
LISKIGLDIVEVARIKRAMRRTAFARRILTEKEQVLYKTAEGVAGRWAAKEAVAKAAGVRLTWQQVEILPDRSGAPVAAIHSSAFDSAHCRIHVSITHERHFAAAVAILEQH